MGPALVKAFGVWLPELHLAALKKESGESEKQFEMREEGKGAWFMKGCS